MRLYPKKLRNIDDLERERRVLQREAKLLDKEEFLPAGSFLKSKGGGDGGDLMDSLIGMLPISNPLVAKGVTMLKDRLMKKKARPAPSPVTTGNECQQKPGIVSRAAREFIGGYLKWKAVELSFKGLRYIIKKAKGQKSEE